jgi:hypothetical protein
MKDAISSLTSGHGSWTRAAGLTRSGCPCGYLPRAAAEGGCPRALLGERREGDREGRRGYTQVERNPFFTPLGFSLHAPDPTCGDGLALFDMAYDK